MILEVSFAKKDQMEFTLANWKLRCQLTKNIVWFYFRCKIRIKLCDRTKSSYNTTIETCYVNRRYCLLQNVLFGIGGAYERRL